MKHSKKIFLITVLFCTALFAQNPTSTQSDSTITSEQIITTKNLPALPPIKDQAVRIEKRTNWSKIKDLFM